MSLKNNLEQLKSNPSLEVKKQITEKISNYLNCNAFNEEEKTIALSIINILVRDVDKEIRKIISRNLKSYPDISQEAATILAKDIENDIAIPMIEFSEVLSDETIEEIVKETTQVSRLFAVTKRKNISERISDNIVDREIEEVTNSLLHNPTARVSETTMEKIILKHSQSKDIINTVINRDNLSPLIIEKLATLISDDLKRKLLSKYNLNLDTVSKLTEDSKEELIANRLGINSDIEEIDELIDSLYKNNQLSHSIILRGLCRGDIVFFSRSLGKLTKVPIKSAEAMIIDEGPTSFAALYKESGMPNGCFDAINIILRFSINILKSKNDITQKEFITELIHKILNEEYDKKINMMNHFLMMISSQLN